MTLDRFQVNLGGLVEVLSQHLYSGPQVYLRELVQNAADAVAARQLEDPDAPATVRLEPWVDEPGLTVTDTGIGMTYAQAEELLATIGQSSKRDAVFGEGRQEFVGQFGIGLLAAFLISDTIEVCSRAVGHPAIRWEGHSDGTFRLAELGGDEQPVGTQVRLRASQYMEDWVATDTVVRLAAEYCSFLPVDIAVKVPVGAGRQWRRITEPELPWLAAYASPRSASAHCAPIASARSGSRRSRRLTWRWVSPAPPAWRSSCRTRCRRSRAGTACTQSACLSTPPPTPSCPSGPSSSGRCSTPTRSLRLPRASNCVTTPPSP
ncbi:ATP-binding protein [Corynebacterium aquatimens]|uniref:ATP-binding protein n=1 Tax=Corynebacterium aquatimens TaxID=1190508 RepID=UPI002540A16A|nr:ATP-binding protein [Corynebacterium aquatimens]QYH20356.1 ATP-binding protein [Corynebacterium aquatimens]